MALFDVYSLSHFVDDLSSAAATAEFSRILKGMLAFPNMRLERSSDEARSVHVKIEELTTHFHKLAEAGAVDRFVIGLVDPKHGPFKCQFQIRRELFPMVQAVVSSKSTLKAGSMAALNSVSLDNSLLAWKQGWGYLGSYDNIYLAIKRTILRTVAFEKVSNDASIVACIEFRKRCWRVAMEMDNPKDNHRVSVTSQLAFAADFQERRHCM